MLAIAGKARKSIALLDFIHDGVILVETQWTRMSHFLSNTDTSCNVVTIENNEREHLETIVSSLSDYFERENIEGVRVIFYVNTSEENYRLFKDFEDRFKLQVIVTVQTQDEEVTYFEVK